MPNGITSDRLLFRVDIQPYAAKFDAIIDADSLQAQLSACRSLQAQISTLCRGNSKRDDAHGQAKKRSSVVSASSSSVLPRKRALAQIVDGEPNVANYPAAEQRHTNLARDCCLAAISVFVLVDERNIALHTALRRIACRLLAHVSKRAAAASRSKPQGEPAPNDHTQVCTTFADALLSKVGFESEAAVLLCRFLSLPRVAEVTFQVERDCTNNKTNVGLALQRLRRLLRAAATTIVAAREKDSGLAANVCDVLAMVVNVCAMNVQLLTTDDGFNGLSSRAEVLTTLRSLVADVSKWVSGCSAGPQSYAGRSFMVDVHRLSALTAFAHRQGPTDVCSALLVNHRPILETTVPGEQLEQSNWTEMTHDNRVALIVSLTQLPLVVNEWLLSTQASTTISDGVSLIGHCFRLLANEWSDPESVSTSARLTADFAKTFFGVGQRYVDIVADTVVVHAEDFNFTIQHVLAVLFRLVVNDRASAMTLKLKLFRQLLKMWSRTNPVDECYISCFEELKHVSHIGRSFFQLVDAILFGVASSPSTTTGRRLFIEHFPTFAHVAFSALTADSDAKTLAAKLLRKLFVLPYNELLKQSRTAEDRPRPPRWFDDLATSLRKIAYEGEDSVFVHILMSSVITTKEHQVCTAVFCHIANQPDAYEESFVWGLLQFLQLKIFASWVRALIPDLRPKRFRPAPAVQDLAPHVDDVVIRGAFGKAAHALDQSAKSSNPRILEDLTMVLLNAPRAAIEDFEIVADCVVRVARFGEGTGLKLAKSLLERIATVCEEHSMSDSLRQLAIALFNEIHRGAPVVRVGNCLDFILKILTSAKTAPKFQSKEIQGVLRKCFVASLYFCYPLVIERATNALRFLLRQEHFRQQVIESPHAVRIIRSYIMRSKTLLSSLHAEYVGSAVTLAAVAEAELPFTAETLSSYTPSSLTKDIHTIASQPHNAIVQMLLEPSSIKLHGNIRLVTSNLEVLCDSPQDLLTLFNSSTALFSAATCVLKSECGAPCPFEDHQWRFKVDCRGHTFARVSMGSNASAADTIPCKPSVATKAWLLLKECTFLLQSVSTMTFAGKEDSIGPKRIVSTIALFRRALTQLKHKGAVSVIAEALQQLVAKHAKRGQKQLASSLLQELIGTTESPPQFLIPRRDCGLSSQFQAVLLNYLETNQADVVDVAARLVAGLDHDVSAQAQHRPSDYTIHLLYCALKLVTNIGNTKPDDRKTLGMMFCAVCRTTIRFGSWNIINAAMLVMSVIVPKITIPAISITTLRKRYPDIFDVCLKLLDPSLIAGRNSQRVNTSGVKNVVYSLLLLFSKLVPFGTVTIDGDTTMLGAHFERYLKSNDHVVRRLAAESLVTVLSSGRQEIEAKLQQVFGCLRSSAQTALRAGLNNCSDGYINFALALVERAPLNSDGVLFNRVANFMFVEVLTARALPSTSLAKTVLVVRKALKRAKRKLPPPMLKAICSLLEWCASQQPGSVFCQELVACLGEVATYDSTAADCLRKGLAHNDTNLTIVILGELSSVFSHHAGETHLQQCAALVRDQGILVIASQTDQLLLEHWCAMMLALNDSPQIARRISALLYYVPKLIEAARPSCFEFAACILQHTAPGDACDELVHMWARFASRFTSPERDVAMRQAVLRGSFSLTTVLQRRTLSNTAADWYCSVLIPLLHDNSSNIRRRAQLLVQVEKPPIAEADYRIPTAGVLFLLCTGYRDCSHTWRHCTDHINAAISTLTELAEQGQSTDTYKVETYDDFLCIVDIAHQWAQAFADSQRHAGYDGKPSLLYAHVPRLCQRLKELEVQLSPNPQFRKHLFRQYVAER